MQQEQDNGLALTGLPEPERRRALTRFQAIRLYLEENVPLTQVAGVSSISLRTARYWVQRYQQDGLAGLARQARNDKDERKLSSDLQQLVEGLALRKPRLSAAAIHRKATETAKKQGGVSSRKGNLRTFRIAEARR